LPPTFRYIPTEDLFGIYGSMYGTTEKIPKVIIRDCTFLLFAERYRLWK